MKRASLVALLALAVACRPLPTAPTSADDDPEFERPTFPLQPGLAADPTPAERVLPGDMLSLQTVSVAPMDVPDLVVDVSGYLHVPVAGPVPVGGHTIEEASEMVEKQLHRYDSRAQVQLRISSALGHHATVIGSVVNQGVFPVTPGMRLADLIAKAGGPVVQLSEGEQIVLADLDAARVLRNGVALPISVGRALDGDVLHNVLIHANDMLIVPPARGQRITILGQVHGPRVIPYRTGLRLTDSVAIAGGFNDVGDQGDIRIVRGPLSHPRIYRASSAALFRGAARDVLLEPGDVVMVTETFFGDVTDTLNRLLPLLLTANLFRGLAQ